MIRYITMIILVLSVFWLPNTFIYQALDKGNLPLQIYPSKANGLNLYIPKSTSVKYKLVAGESARFQYSGSSGKWLYGSYKGQSIVVKDDRKLGYRFPILGLVEQQRLADHIKFFILIACLVFMIVMFFSLRTRLKKNETQYLNEIDNKSERIARYQDSIHTLTNFKSDLIDKNMQYSSNEKNYRRLLNEKEKEVQQLNAFIKQLKSSYEVSIEEQKELLLEEFIKAAEIKYLPKIQDMQAENSKLDEQLRLVKEQAKVFDVNFDDKKFDSILKGRQFEVFVASTFVNKHGCEILEWTPDKGFNAGVYAESSSNPDLLLKDAHGHLFAVECKFRSKYYFKTRDHNPPPKEINWGYKEHGKRYQEYAKTRNLEVYVAIGFSGEATYPEFNFLVPLNTLLNYSTINQYKSNNNYVVKRDSIVEFEIKNNDFYNLILSEIEV